jgi:type IV/VI secretion system ImpK/VasF family protein
MTIFEYFSPIFLKGLRLDAQLGAGSGVVPPYVEVRDKFIADLEDVKKRAIEAGKKPQDVEEAAFAVAAWLDESSAKFPDWWAHTTPIQKLVFSTNNAGNEFFERLNRLNRQQDEVREVYYVALCLGFAGQYYYEVGDEGELGRIRESLSRQLPRPPAALGSLGEDRITSQPYTLPDPPGPRLPRRSGKGLLKAAVALAIFIPIAALLYLLLTQERPPAGPPLADLVAPVIERYECAKLEPSVVEESRTISISGRVQTEADKTRLSSELGALPDVSAVNIQNVGVEARPFCAVMDVLDPYVMNNEANALGVTVTPLSHGTSFMRGEDLVLELRTPRTDGYIYVDYFQKDGNVVHLYPNALEKENYFPRNAKVSIGHRQPGKRHWEILPPFGRELITIVSHPSPLFAQERPEVEPAEQYLATLGRALPQGESAAETGAQYFFIETRDAN